MTFDGTPRARSSLTLILSVASAFLVSVAPAFATPVPPTLSLQASPAVTLGAPVSVTATLEGTSPTGQIMFRLFPSSDATCTGAAVFTNLKIVSANGAYASDQFTPTSADTYRWTATYLPAPGDPNNSAVQSACGSAGSTVVVSTSSPPGGGTPGDAKAPDTSFTQSPKSKLKLKRSKRSASATFAFTSTEPGSRFECKTDDGPFAACTSPTTIRLKKGKHTFEVVAVDAAGNRDATPAKVKVKVKVALKK